ncbi:class I SAM-dependent methyltransferase [Vulcanococcus sp.]|jgi:SAM-dependent methyltransferase|uniref:class I SAM-dependent methyltransferase n=1 Tax=Vulcanococcus sp. TaxID=2856995 RepID=UPI0037DA4AAD
MERVPEPELMDGAEQATAYAAADFSASDGAVITRLGELFPGGLGSQVVDLGCGPGNISFRLAKLRPAPAQVLAIDGAPSMLALAARELERRRQAEPELPRRLLFRLSCLPDPALPGGFSAVVSNSLLHHLHDPAVLWGAVRQLAAPGACIYVKDLRRPADAAAVEALVQRHAADAPPVLQHDYRASLHAAFTPEEVRGQLRAAGLAGSLQVAPTDDRYLEVWGRLD